MDIRKYAALNDVFVDKPMDTWLIVGYIKADGQYQSLRTWKDIGKRDDTAIRNIDKFKAALD